ncbi:MAG: ABC transporter substrate-binding protein [Planctomycetota bacterium]
MENRFGFRDVIVVVLLLAVLVMIGLAMVQFDRQYTVIRRIASTLEEQTASQARLEQALTRLNNRLERGEVAIGVATPQGTPAAPPADAQADAFPRLAAAVSQPEFTRGDWLVDAFASNPSKLTPLVSKDLYGRRIQNYIFDNLIVQDPDTFEYRGQLAESWDIEPNLEAWQAWVDAWLAEPITDAEIPAEIDALGDRLDADTVRGLIERMRTEGLTPAPFDSAEAFDAASSALNTGELAALYGELRRQEGRRYEDAIRQPDAPPAATYTFRMRPGAVFSDGTPVTSEDVVFSWDLLNNPAVDAHDERAFYDNIRAWEALDDRTVRFESREPHYLAFGFAGGRPVMPKHFYERFTPEQINTSSSLLMGSGPYRMAEPDEGWRPGTPIELVRNDRFWGPQPAFDRLVWKIINEPVARLTEYRNGSIDFLAAQPNQYQEMLNEPDLVERSHHSAVDTVPSGYAFVAWNQRRGGEPTRFADKRVRQAMTYLIDRDRISEEMMKGYARPANGPFEPGNPQRNPELDTRSLDVAKARALLAEAGYEDRDGDGVIEAPDGTPFEFTFTYPSGASYYDDIALFIKDTMAKAGILVKLEKLEWAVFVQRLDNRNFDAVILRWGGGAIESDIRQMFHSSQIANRGNNFNAYSNPELDVIIDQARKTLDRDERMALWHQAHAILWEDQPYTFMFTQKALRFVDDRVANIEAISSGLNDRVEWFVPGDAQRWTQ